MNRIIELAETRSAHLMAARHREFIAKIEAKVQSEINDLVVVSDSVFFLISSVLDQPAIAKNKEYHDVTHFLLARAMKTFWSIRCLLLAGCDQDAMALTRNIAETSATLEFIVKESVSERMDRFRQYEHIERSKNANKNRTAGFEPTVEKNLLIEAERRRPELEKKYGDHYGKHWSGMNSIEGVFKKLDMTQHYISHFSSASMLTHASYLSRHQYKRSFGESPSWAPTSKNSKNACFLAVEGLVRLAKTYCTFHDVPEAEPIFVEIDWNLLSRFSHDGYEINHPELQELTPVPKDTWGVLPMRENSRYYYKGDLKPYAEAQSGEKILHREDGPAFVDRTNEKWYRDGQLHRAGGPAETNFDVDGRAIEEKWWFNGKSIMTPQELLDYARKNGYSGARIFSDADERVNLSAKVLAGNAVTFDFVLANS